jgi:hypothetical protein
MTTQVTQVTYDDPFDSAMNPQTFSNDLFGKVSLNAWYCVLEKGFGRVPFDPAQHPINQRRTAIDVTIDPLPELGITNANVCERRMLAESKDWRTITLQSLHDLGIQDVRSVNGAWVRIEACPTGRTYEKNGETKNETAFKFLAIYPDEAACRADYSGGNGASTASTPAGPAHTEGNGGNSLEKQAAAQFLKVIVTNAIAGKKPEEYRDAVTSAIAGFPMVSKFFNVDSPEVQELLPPF